MPRGLQLLAVLQKRLFCFLQTMPQTRLNQCPNTIGLLPQETTAEFACELLLPHLTSASLVQVVVEPAT